MIQYLKLTWLMVNCCNCCWLDDSSSVPACFKFITTNNNYNYNNDYSNNTTSYYTSNYSTTPKMSTKSLSDKCNKIRIPVRECIIYIYIYIYIKKSNEIRMLVHIKEISKKRTRRIFHNILVLTFSLLLFFPRRDLNSHHWYIHTSQTVYVSLIKRRFFFKQNFIEKIK